MPYVKLEIPPGVVRNGTKYQSMGRWYSANLVRWSEGAMQPIGGWTPLPDSNDEGVSVTDPVRGMYGWKSNNHSPYLAIGTYNKAYAFGGGTLTDITPAGFTAGSIGASSTVGGYGVGNYGLGAYGRGTGGGGYSINEANSWQFDNFGENLVACAYSDGKIYAWDPSGGSVLTLVDASAPTGCQGVVVTPERFVVALGGGSYAAPSTKNVRQLAWCDQEDYTEWDPTAAGSQAGDFILPGSGEVMCASRNRNETLIWTDVDLFAMRYIGGVLVYSFTQVGENVGAISRRATTTVDGRAYWMGHRGFYMYDGYAKPIPCPLGDLIFNELNDFEASRVATWSVSEFNEIWFSYPTASETDRIVSYNYLEDHWSGPWDIERTDGIDRSAFGYGLQSDPLGRIFYHERGTSYLNVSESASLVPGAESGPMEIGQGDQVMTVRRYIPDESSFGDVDATLYAGFYPTDPVEDEQQIVVGQISDARLTGRQVRLKIEQVDPNWRFGNARLEVVARGRR